MEKINRYCLVFGKLYFVLLFKTAATRKSSFIFQFESFIIMFLTIIQGGNYSSEETIQGRKLFKGGNYYY
jgi:hypothetical protein